jgi:hypothetical protein
LTRHPVASAAVTFDEQPSAREASRGLHAFGFHVKED